MIKLLHGCKKVAKLTVIVDNFAGPRPGEAAPSAISPYRPCIVALGVPRRITEPRTKTSFSRLPLPFRRCPTMKRRRTSLPLSHAQTTIQQHCRGRPALTRRTNPLSAPALMTTPCPHSPPGRMRREHQNQTRRTKEGVPFCCSTMCSFHLYVTTEAVSVTETVVPVCLPTKGGQILSLQQLVIHLPITI